MKSWDVEGEGEHMIALCSCAFHERQKTQSIIPRRALTLYFSNPEEAMQQFGAGGAETASCLQTEENKEKEPEQLSVL